MSLVVFCFHPTKCKFHINFVPHPPTLPCPSHRKCKMHLGSARCGPQSQSNEAWDQHWKAKKLYKMVGKFCMQSRWCIGQFCIEHITCRPNLTKFSQKRSIRWKCILQACCLFSDTKLLTLLVTTFCSYLSSLLSVWNNLFNQFECLGKQHWTWYWEMPFRKIFLSQSRIYYLSI